MHCVLVGFFFVSSRRRHTRSLCDWSSDVCSSDLLRSRRFLAERWTFLIHELYISGRSMRAPAHDHGRNQPRRGKNHERGTRSEERRVGKECRARGAQCPLKQKKEKDK